MQLRVLRLRFLQDGNVGVSVFGIAGVQVQQSRQAGRDQKSVSPPTLALPEQEYTPGDTLSEVPYVSLSLVSSTRL